LDITDIISPLLDILNVYARKNKMGIDKHVYLWFTVGCNPITIL